MKRNSQAHLRGCKHGHIAYTLSYENYVKNGAKPSKQDRHGMQIKPKIQAKPKGLNLDHVTYKANDQNESNQSQIMLRQAPKTT